ncbi:MAG TPA: FAD/NAD(P)-binding protein [Rhizomicrobium sp.]|nr:FAD/NAD(P)-binding protein [Rhizomicrobium sp.]
MTVRPPSRKPMTVAVVGGGFTGSLFALKLSAAQPDWRVLLIEHAHRHGRGLAYGACAPCHYLNVPIPRMELGLVPGFADWLRAKQPDVLAEALAESGGEAGAAFVTRRSFGDYMEACLADGLSHGGTKGLALLRGQAVRVLDPPARGLLLEDGREIRADIVVLALGNLPPRPPPVKDGWFYDTPDWIPDPWARGALDGIAPDAPVAMIGSGQTMVDIALKLAEDGHAGPLHAISRHGLLPLVHKAGGEWEPFARPGTPLALMRDIRAAARKAEARGIPWQRVIDAVRPNIAQLWDAWAEKQRRQFLRHARARWDVHRSRMPPKVAAMLQVLIDRGQLTVSAGRVAGYRAVDGGVDVLLPRGRSVFARHVINCTGPNGDLSRIATPLVADLRRRGDIAPDALGLGLETEDCAARDNSGRASTWLFALGPPTRPAWWEITAVPEVAAQVDRLVEELSSPQTQPARGLAEVFVDLGAGI